jgi:hypothetical protein
VTRDQSRSGGDPIEVYPNPTPEEAAAIVAALQLMRRPQPKVMNAPVNSTWQRAGRDKALRTELDHGDGGWSRVARLGI